MNALSYSKHSFSVGIFPIAFSIITFTLQLAQGFLPASSSPRLTVARKTSPSPPPPPPTHTPTPTTSCAPTPTLSSDYPDVSTMAMPLLVSLGLVVLGILVSAGSTYIRRKSGTIFTPLTPPRRKEQDPPQPPNPPSPNEDDYSADDKGEGDKNEDDDSDGDSSSGDDEDRPEDDESEDSSDDDPDDPDDPSSSSNVEEPPSSSPNPNLWDILLLAILYLACIIKLTAKFSAAPIKRIANSLSRCLNNVSTEITLSVRKILDCVLVWLDQSLLQLYDEMMWINNERPPRPAFDIGMSNFGFKSASITLYATDELHELKHALLDKIEPVSRAPSTWASQVCPFFRGNDSIQNSHFNDNITSNLTWTSARPPSGPLEGDTIVPKPATTSSIHSILSAAVVYGAIGALIQMFRNAHARRARIPQDFGEEGTTLFNENAGSTVMDDILGDDENEDPEEEATGSNVLQGPDSVTANERYVQGNSERECSHGNDDLCPPEAESPSDVFESAIAYTTALSISGTFACIDELRTHENASTSTMSISYPSVSPLPPHETSPEECTHEDERYGDPCSSTTTNTIAHLMRDAPAGVPQAQGTANVNDFDFPVTQPPPNRYSDNEPEYIEVSEEEDDREREHFIQEEDWYEEEEIYGDEYPGFYEDECETSTDTSPEEHESSEELGHYVQEEDVYEEENLYGDEYPGFYDDEDIEEGSDDKPGVTTNEEECPNGQKPEQCLGEMDMDIEESEPSVCYVGTPETSPKGRRSTTHKDRAQTIIIQSVAALEMTRKRYVEGETKLATPPGDRARSKTRRRTRVSVFSEEDQEARMIELERVRQQFIEEEEARLEAAGDSAHFPDAEPIEGSDISIYFRRRPSSKFRYTEGDSLEGQCAAPNFPTSIAEERLVQMRALVEKAYSLHEYDPSQIDALTRWHLGLKDEEDSC